LSAASASRRTAPARLAAVAAIRLGCGAGLPTVTATARLAAVTGLPAIAAARLHGLGGFALEPGERLLRSALLLLTDELSELRLGVLAPLAVFGRELVDLALLLGDLLREAGGLVTLVLEILAILVDLGDQLVEIVGRAGPHVQRHAAVLVAPEIGGVGGRIGEQRAEHVGAGAGERAHRDLGEVTTQLVQLGFLGGQPLLGLADLDLELRLVVDRDRVLLGEDVGLLVQAVELVDDALHLGPLAFDGGERGLRVHQRRGDHDGRCQEDGSGEATRAGGLQSGCHNDRPAV
jgi:hypothetical protein